jgi:hypothetical protein
VADSDLGKCIEHIQLLMQHNGLLCDCWLFNRCYACIFHFLFLQMFLMVAVGLTSDFFYFSLSLASTFSYGSNLPDQCECVVVQ